MNKKICDKCSAEASFGDTIQQWDESFSQNTEGVVWFVGVKGNYMNAPIDVCRRCALDGLRLLAKRFLC